MRIKDVNWSVYASLLVEADTIWDLLFTVKTMLRQVHCSSEQHAHFR